MWFVPFWNVPLLTRERIMNPEHYRHPEGAVIPKERPTDTTDTTDSETELNGLSVGKYNIERVHNLILISHVSGESGGFSVDMFEAFLDRFFNENF